MWFVLHRFDSRGAVFLLHGHYDQGPHLPTLRHPTNVSCHQVSRVVSDTVECAVRHPLLPTRHQYNNLKRRMSFKNRMFWNRWLIQVIAFNNFCWCLSLGDIFLVWRSSNQLLSFQRCSSPSVFEIQAICSLVHCVNKMPWYIGSTFFLFLFFF